MASISTTTNSGWRYVHGGYAADTSSFPEITVKFDVVCTREEGSSEVSWKIRNMEWDTPYYSGAYGYYIRIYVSVNPVDPYDPDYDTELVTILQKETLQGSYWWNHIDIYAPDYPYQKFNSTTTTGNCYIYAEVDDCCRHNNNTEACFYTNAGSHFCLFDSFSISVPTYETTATISYNANGGTNAPAAQTKSSLSDLTLTTAVPNYPVSVTYHNSSTITDNFYRQFINWNSNAGGTGYNYASGGTYGDNTNPPLTTTNQTLYAKWGNATFNPRALDTNNISVKYSFESVARTYGREQRGYSNSSTSTDIFCTPGTPKNITESVHLYPQYGAATFTTLPLPNKEVVITFNPVGGDVSPTYAAISCSKVGYATSSGGAKVYNQNQSVSSSSNLNLYALYGNATLSKSSIPTPTRQGYRFVDWYYDSTYTNPVGTTISTDHSIVIYAKWIPLPVHQVQPDGTWNNQGPYVWQCVMENGTKVWRKAAKLYKFDGTNWQNISE